jgi:hypothetical protein
MNDVLKLLELSREYASDWQHIVIDSENILENAKGKEVSSASFEDASRGCLLGIPRIVAHKHGLERARLKVEDLLTDAAFDEGLNLYSAPSGGVPTMLRVFDNALKYLKGEREIR